MPFKVLVWTGRINQMLYSFPLRVGGWDHSRGGQIVGPE